MSRVYKLPAKFPLVPEGWTVLQIVKADFDEKANRYTIRQKDKQNRYHTDFFNLFKKSGEENVAAQLAFANLARVAMQDPDMKSVDLDLLEGKFVRAEVEHDYWNDRKVSRVKQREEANGFDEDVPQTEEMSLDEFLEDEDDATS